jgi:hypothetical protein
MEVKELILDYSKWRCGDDGDNKVGTGTTGLLNDQGYMCCLGQWCHQLGAPLPELLNNGEPQGIKTTIHLFVEEELPDGKYGNALTAECIRINDEPETTPDEKITQLTERLAKEGITLKVINKPSQPSTHAH